MSRSAKVTHLLRLRSLGSLAAGWRVLTVRASTAAADQVDTLIRRLQTSDDYKVRLSAALNLSKLYDPRSIPLFIGALGESDNTVRGVAAASLGK